MYLGEKYNLEKKVWTDADFERMGWHDCFSFKIRIEKDFALDIDYILQWNEPEVTGMPFSFWVAPATLVFKNISGLNIEFNVGMGQDDCFQIDSIERGKDNRWSIITQQGDFQFIANGYQQFIRQEPFFQFQQIIPYKERNGYSLEQTTDQENTSRNREDIIAQRKTDFELYDYAKKRRMQQLELERLTLLRDNNEVDLKTFLLKKRAINELLFSYSYYVRGTPFEDW